MRIYCEQGVVYVQSRIKKQTTKCQLLPNPIHHKHSNSLGNIMRDRIGDVIS